MRGSQRGVGAPIRRVRRGLCWLAALGVLAPWTAHTAEIAEPDARAVRAVVEAQLAAFAEDDAERAFSYASAAVRAQFGDAKRFIAMVRGGYPMVVRPASVAFFKARAVAGDREALSRRCISATVKVGSGWPPTCSNGRGATVGESVAAS